MLGKLNILSYSLAVGAMGQYWFYKHLFPHIPAWLIWGILFVPWVTVFTISFCKRPPFGPRPFGYCLLFAMGWYACATLAAEVLNFVIATPLDRHFPVSVARILMYLAASSFIPFTRAYLYLRRIAFQPKHD